MNDSHGASEALGEFTQSHPGLLIFLVDQSASMHLTVDAHGITRAERATHIVNRTLANIIARLGRDAVTGETPGVCDIAVWAYSEEPWPIVPNGGLPISISYLAEHHRREPAWQDATALTSANAPGFWVSTEYGGPGSDLVRALSATTRLIDNWLNRDPSHRASAPPIVVHLSDGLFDRTPNLRAALGTLCAPRTAVGAVSLVNVCLPEEDEAHIFPLESSDLAIDELFLWHTSSPVSTPIVQRLQRAYASSARKPPWYGQFMKQVQRGSLPQAYLAHPDGATIAEILSAFLV